MKEIYFKDHRGDMHTMTIEEYERARGITREQIKAPGKDTGFPIREAGGENTPETNDQKPI